MVKSKTSRLEEGMEGGKMIENPQTARSDACSPTDSTATPSCYRLSVMSGLLEVSARLKSADDLELLLQVLEANKALYTKAGRSETETFAKANGSDAKTSAKADRLTQILTA
jgi:hypothetical protein